jgi:hypothetical protein
MCDKCGQRFRLKTLKKETWAGKQLNFKVCQSCWDPDHPQLMLGKYPVNDPQAVREPRPDTTYDESRALILPIVGATAFGYAGAVTEVTS